MDIVDLTHMAAARRTSRELTRENFKTGSPFGTALFGSSPPTSSLSRMSSMNDHTYGMDTPGQPALARASEPMAMPMPRRSSLEASLTTFSRSFKAASGFSH